MSVPTSPNVPAFGATVDAPPGHFRLLHSFGNNSDGRNPYAGLTQLNGTLYGVTEGGGTGGYGAIYSLSVTGKEKILYSLTQEDGYSPEGDLLAYHGLLYGTVPVGGNSGGIVYSITPSGKFTILHRFSETDGGNPATGLMEHNGTMYGTTYQGGGHGVGTLYAVQTSGSERVIYSFGSYSGDATYPLSTPIFWKKKFYGTSAGGGAYNEGTVFSVTPTGKETVLHSFGGPSDGKSPGDVNLTLLDGALYGTTTAGGKYADGVVFRVLPSGAVQTVYSFGSTGADGGGPNAGLIVYRGELYGTTGGGGASDQGTVFRITTSGKESVLYSFSGNDGSQSLSRLLVEGTNMYGTMFNGGVYGGTGFKGGTAYRFTP
jgi:uncharacterized repeat protein (TIGR03803 family)